VSTSITLKRTLAIALAGGSLAIGVPAALGASGGGDAGSTTAPSSTLIQDEQDGTQQNRDDCPERDGAGSGSEGQDGAGSGSESQDGATAAPSV